MGGGTRPPGRPRVTNAMAPNKSIRRWVGGKEGGMRWWWAGGGEYSVKHPEKMTQGYY